MEKIIFIAEAGVNHNGSLDMAIKLIDSAADAGADFVKFQTFKADSLVAPFAKMAEYQKENCKGDNYQGNQYKMLEDLSLPREFHKPLIEHCEKRGISFLSTPFSLQDLDFLNDMVPLWKIPSGEITNFPLIRRAAGTKKPIIISSGMANLEEIKKACEQIYSVWNDFGIQGGDEVHIGKVSIPMLTVLHCTSAYPAPFDEINLKAIQTIRKELFVNVGYSDHTTGIHVPIAAISLGARVLEKHFTLDKDLPGPDHKASIDTRELNLLLRNIRDIEAAMGSGIKQPSEAEEKNIPIVRKSLFFSMALKKGYVIDERSIIALRPGDGISPSQIDKIIGKKLIKSKERYDYVLLEDLE